MQLVFSLNLNEQNQDKTASSDENIIKQEISIERLSLFELVSNWALTSCSWQKQKASKRVDGEDNIFRSVTPAALSPLSIWYFPQQMRSSRVTFERFPSGLVGSVGHNAFVQLLVPGSRSLMLGLWRKGHTQIIYNYYKLLICANHWASSELERLINKVFSWPNCSTPCILHKQ